MIKKGRLTVDIEDNIGKRWAKGTICDVIDEKQRLIRIEDFSGHGAISLGYEDTECRNNDCYFLNNGEFEIIEDEEILVEEEAEKAETTVYTPVDCDGPKKLIVIYVDKEMTTKRCIAHARTVEEHLGHEYRVLVVDRKVTNVEVK